MEAREGRDACAPTGQWSAGLMRLQIAHWMQARMMHLTWPRLFKFWEWVVCPNGLGFRSWLRWATQDS
jgi:hypothetical protein